jgi:hypothetical protein
MSLTNSACQNITTPLDPGASDTLVPYQGLATEDQIKLYQSLVGCINYLATQTRCDIAFTASALSRFLVNPAPAHAKSAKRVLQYPKGTIIYGITYGGLQYNPQRLILSCTQTQIMLETDTRIGRLVDM